MKITGIVAEYNPFHNGHRYLAEKLRENGATHIIVVMSGHLMQRGELPVFSKWTRTEAALKCGVDMVVELPSLFSGLSAERFAFAAVTLFDRMGCVDALGFGSEAGDTEALLRAAEACTSPKADAFLRMELSAGLSYAAARQRAVERFAGRETAELLSLPNNILAVEYCKALQKLGSNIVPETVRRLGTGHDSSITQGGVASASFLREELSKGNGISHFVPLPAAKVYRAAFKSGQAPCRMNRLELLFLYRLRELSPNEFDRLPDVSEGLASRLYQAAREAGSLEEFYSLAKTKRYAYARLRRIALYAVLGITKEDLLRAPAYLRVLGMNERGREVAAELKASAKLPYGTRFAQLAKVDPRAALVEERAGDLFSLGLPTVPPAGMDYTAEAVIL